MIDLSRVEKYYAACGYTDLRRGIDGLAAIVSQQYGRDLCEDSLFLFCGRRTDRIKALYYSGDGYIPVSYTHLDVYKRQGISSGIRVHRSLLQYQTHS